MQAMLVLYLISSTGFVSAPMNVAQFADIAACKAAAANAVMVEKAPTQAKTVFVCAPMSAVDVPDGPRLPR
jgi:hypothetical protein